MLPMRSQGDEIDSVDKCIVRLGQRRRNGFLGQSHPSIISFKFEFLLCLRHGRRGLNLCHAISQELTDNIFFRANRARVDAILDRASQRNYPKSKNGYT